MSIVKSRSGLPRLLIKDGKLVEKELTASSFTLDWVHQQLSIRNIASISDVMLGQIDRSGFIYIDLYEKEQTT
nr:MULTISPECIES: YetF domain-containing protein [Bacillaceae]